MVDVSRVVLAVDSRQVKGASRDLDNLDRAGRNVTRTTSQLGQAFRVLGSVISVAAVARFTQVVINASDQMANLRGQLRLVTDGQRELNSVYDQALSLSNRTGSTLDSTINLYARLARSTEELRLGQQQLFTITEAINQSFVVSGASTQEAASATLQLSQGLAAGALRGEELNSVMENSPRLARALADGLGVTIGQLRAMGADGELTAEAVTTALTKMADTIDADFQKMPMTVERATNEMRNNLADLFGSVDSSNAVEAVQRINEALSDPELRESVKFLANGMVDIGAGAVEATVKFVRFGKEVAKFAPGAIYGRAIGWLFDKIAPLVGIYDDLEEVTVSHSRVLNSLAVPATLRLGNLYEEMSEEMEELAEQHEKFKSAVQDAMDALRPHEAHARKTMETYRLLERAVRENIIAQKDLDEWWKKNGLQEIEVQVKRVTNEIDEITARANPMAKIYERGIERMRDGFGDFFQDLIVDGKASFDGLLNLFKRMIAEMIATAAANRIMVSIGMMTAGQAAQAGGMLGSGSFSLSGLAQIPGMIGGSAISGIASLGNAVGLGPQAAAFLGNTGQLGYNALSSLGIQGAGGTTSFLAGAGLTAGAGFLGGQAGQAIFGQGNRQANSSLGQMAGGIGGAAIGAQFGAIGGPIGAAIGAAIGAGLDVLFGSTKPSDKRQYAGMGLGTGELQTGGFSGAKFSQENLDTAIGLVNQFQAMADAIGGSNALVNVSVGGRTGVRYASGGSENYREFADSAALMSAAFADILEGATNLAPAVKELAQSFDGNAEAAIDYTRSLQSLWELTGQNGVTAAMQAQEDAQRTLLDIYRTNTNNVRQLAADYDGSAQATQMLSQALAENQGMAYQLALQYRQVSDSVGMLFGGLSESIRTSLMTSEELYNYQRSQVDGLTATLATLTDPAQIMETSQRIEQMIGGMWSSLSDPQRQEMGGGFLQTIQDVQDLATSRLNDQLKMLEESQERTGEVVRDGIRESANDLARSAQDHAVSSQMMLEAVGMFQDVVNQLQAFGLPVSLPNGSEVAG